MIATTLNGDTRWISSEISYGRNAAVATNVRYSAQRFISHRPTASTPSTSA